MINLKNTQKKISINREHIILTAQKIITELKYKEFDLGIWFTTNETIRKYNKLYRQQDKATDILSFPYHNLQAGERIKIIEEEDKNLGDLIISPSYVEKILPLYKITFDERITVLLIHGICHLLGYSHYDPNNDLLMTRLEKSLLKKINKNLISCC